MKTPEELWRRFDEVRMDRGMKDALARLVAEAVEEEREEWWGEILLACNSWKMGHPMSVSSVQGVEDQLRQFHEHRARSAGGAA